MAEDNKNVSPELNGETVDIISERKIKAVESVHTSDKPEEVLIPDGETDSIQLGEGSSRFIKTADTPFVSVRAQQDEQEHLTDVTKYTDRFTTKASEGRLHTGYTGKINTYDAVHSVADTGEKMIKPAADAGDREIKADDAFVSSGETKIMDIPLPDSSDPSDDGLEPTKYVRTKGSLLREIADSADDGVRRNPDQLMMEGFDDREKEEEKEKARRQEAAHLEKELDMSRQKRISNFKFWNQSDETGSSADEKFSGEAEIRRLPAFLQKIADRFSYLDNSFAPVKSEEYTDENERKAVFATLIDARKNALARIFIVAVLGVALFFTDLAASVSAANNGGFFTVFGGSNNVLITVNLVILAICAAVMAADLKNGIFSLLKIRPKADTALLLMLCAALVQNITAYFTQLKLESDYHLLTPAVLLLCLPYLFAKLFYLDNTRQCFKPASSKSDKSYLRKVSDPNLSARLLCESMSEDNNVVYSGKTRFISSFLQRSARCAFNAMPSSRIIAACTGAALISAIIAWIMKGSFAYCITAFTLCLAFSFPVSCLIASGWAIARENKKLSVKSSFVLSYADARDFASVDNIAADASELVDAEITNCLTSKNVSERQARFVAASIANKAGSVMAKTFAGDISAFEEKLPPAENLVYEDKLGLSAWVSGCKVLLGTHSILVNHNVKVPEESVVRSLLGEDEQPLYLAIEGQFTAVFAIKYTRSASVGTGLSDLVAGGTNLLISTTDANISEVFAEKLLDLPDGCVRIIGNSAADQLADAKNTVTDAEDAGIVFTDSFGSLCRCAAAAIRLDRIKRTARLICAAGECAFSLVAFVLVVTGAFAKIKPFAVILIQAAWIGFCFMSPLIKVQIPSFLSKNKKNGKKNAAVQPEEITEEEPEEPEYVQEELKVIPAEDEAEQTENPAEKIIPKIEEPEPPVEGEVSEEAAEALKTFEPEEEAVTADLEKKDDVPSGPVTSEKFKKTVASIGGLFSKLTVAEEEPEEETEVRLPEKHKREKKGPGFSLFTKGEERYNKDKSAEEIERDYEEKKRTEKEIRATFTAPEMPEAPIYDLGKEEKAEPQTSGSFEPPVSTGDIDVFDDALFSRFEDDKIFAGLREDENNKKYDF